ASLAGRLPANSSDEPNKRKNQLCESASADWPKARAATKPSSDGFRPGGGGGSVCLCHIPSSARDEIRFGRHVGWSDSVGIGAAARRRGETTHQRPPGSRKSRSRNGGKQSSRFAAAPGARRLRRGDRGRTGGTPGAAGVFDRRHDVTKGRGAETILQAACRS